MPPVLHAGRRALLLADNRLELGGVGVEPRLAGVRRRLADHEAIKTILPTGGVSGGPACRQFGGKGKAIWKDRSLEQIEHELGATA